MKNNKKKVLVYAHYYFPDVASTGQILKELCEGMRDEFEVTVICTVPSYTGEIEEIYKVDKYYSENINGIKIIRVRVPEFTKSDKISRINNLLTYFFRAIWTTIRIDKQDYIFTISQPPILGGVLGVIGKWFKGGKLIYNIQDFNPEQTIAVGYSNNKFILKTALAIDRFSCYMSDKVIVVGRDMQETLHNRFSNIIPPNVFINNWIDETEVYPLEKNNENVLAFKKKYGIQDKKIIMYSGNIGLYYDLENLIKVIEKFKDRNDVVFTFVGDGTKKKEIETYTIEHQLTNVIFIPYQDKKNLLYSLNACDAQFCISAKGIKGVSVPSKIYGIMAAGKPIIGVLENGAEARFIMEETKCGLVSEPGDYESLEDNIRWFIDNTESKQETEMGMRGREYLVNNLTKNISIKKYIKEILNS